MDPEESAFDDEPMQAEEEKKDYSEEDFKFMQTLEYHTGSVKAVATNDKGLMMSGSVDQTCKLYTLDETSGKYEFLQELNHHDHYVYAVITERNNKGFFTSGKDQRIFMLDNSGNPDKIFEGHTGLVNMLAQIDDNTLVSGSWDGTAKIWDISTGQCTHTLEGHSHAVAVFVTPDGRVITGSQDKIIRIWTKEYKIYKQWEAHGDIIRQFADFSPVGFVSCSNDSIIKIWTYEGELISELKGHTGFVFAVHTLPNNIIVSGSDDTTLKIWKDCSCVQSLEFPGTVWDITHNVLGDIIIASENKKVYVFTRDSERAAKDKDLAEYQASLKAANKTGELDLNTIPHVDKQSQYTGKKEGEIKIFKDSDNTAKAYMWKSDENKWELIGYVDMPSGPPPESTKYYEGDRIFEAGEYDHVFDIEIGDGVMRKLPFNNGGNSHEAANKFCVRENFGRGNVEQIVTFIKTNSLPYATREIQDNTSGPAEQKPQLKHIPMQTYLYFDSVNVSGPEKKIREFNEELKTVEESRMKNLDRLLKVIGEKQHYHSSELYKQEWDVFKALLSWPNKYIFPVLDIFRMFLTHSQASEMFKVFEHGCEHLTQFLSILSCKDEPTPNHLLSLRCITNMFKHPSSTYVLISKFEKVIDWVVDYLSHENKNIRNSAITVLLNYSVAFLTRKDDNQGRVQSIAGLVDVLDQESEPQNFMRILAAIGNLIFDEAEVQGLAKDFGLLDKLSSVEKFKGSDVHEKCSSYSEEIQTILR